VYILVPIVANVQGTPVGEKAVLACVPPVMRKVVKKTVILTMDMMGFSWTVPFV
jgi:hypothetical protein